MKPELRFISIKDINIGPRFRELFGDIEGLADSIKDKGVLQPVTVDTNLNLLAGGRRVQAAIAAGLTEIPALIRKVEGEIDTREIELVENVARKDFEWDERCRLTAEIDRLYKAKNIDWSGRKTAQLLDRSQSSVVRDLQLAEMITTFPELAKL